MFTVSGMHGFKLFSVEHITVLLIFLSACCALVYFRKKPKKCHQMIKWTLFLLLPVCEISLQLWLILTDQWNVNDLPLQLCSISTVLAMYLFWKKNEKVFYLLYFFATLPPFLAMVTPEMLYTFPHFRFIEYFLHHSILPLSALYFILYEGYRVPRKAILFTFVIVNIMAAPIFISNQLLGTNFFYLASPTETKTILTFFGNGFWYYMNLEIAALFVFSVTFLPMGIIQKKEFLKGNG